MIYVKRAINGISINGTEYLLGDNKEPMPFQDEEEAKSFLRQKGVEEEEMEDLLFVEE